MDSGEWHTRLVDLERRYYEALRQLDESFVERSFAEQEFAEKESRLLDIYEDILYEMERFPNQYDIDDAEDYDEAEEG